LCGAVLRLFFVVLALALGCGGAAAQSADPAPSAAGPAAAAGAPIDETPGLVLPAIEIVGFQFLLNRTNRYLGTGREDYRVTGSSIDRNLRSGWGTDRDPFNVNQLGHPYQGAMYHGFGRSVGLDYWHSLGLAFAGSAVWEIAGERTRPSRNDQVASGIGGTFLGEALFRMSSLLLEKGGGMSPFWRELSATAIDPSAGFNRWLYRDRENAPFSSNGAAYASRLGIGYVGTTKRELGTSGADVDRSEAQVDFAIDYGLPGPRSYEYTRPFDYFAFHATASSANGVESVTTRGLLVGRSYSAGPSYRGVWGLYGSFAYIAPQTFRVSTSALSLGTTGQWWLGDTLSLQGTALAGVGYAAVGTTHGRPDDRDYNYGVAPQAIVNLRLTHNDTASLDLTGREFFVSRVASGTSGGRDNIVRGEAALTLRIARQHAVTLKVVGNRRDARFVDPSTERQTQVTVGLFYTLLGQDRFGAVDWR
jgi:hypothetical protein